jgi:MFS family permease
MHAKRTLCLLTLLSLTNYIDRWIIAAVMPPLQAELGLSNTQSGFIMSAFMLGYFVTSPFFGYLADRVSRTNLIMIGTGLWSAASGLSGFSRSGIQMFLSRAAVGVGEASNISSTPSILADLFPRKDLNKAMAIWTATIPVGSALGFVLGGFIENHFGWRMAFFVAGIPGLILIAAFYFFVKEPIRGRFDKEEKSLFPPTFKNDVKKLLKNTKYIYAVLGYAAFTFTVGGFASWAPKYLLAVRGVPLHIADTWFGALTVLTGVSGTLMGGWIATSLLKRNTHGDFWLILVSTLVSIPLTFGAFFMKSQSGFFITIGLAEFFLFMSQAPVNVIIVESVGPMLRGLANAFCIFTIHLLGDFISPPLVGFVSDKTSLAFGVLVLPTALFFALYFYWCSFRATKKLLT